ncbi:MAG: GerMN domain-containing protein [bacterium]
MKKWITLIFLILLIAGFIVIFFPKKIEKGIFIPPSNKIKVELFFPDSEEQCLIPEQREIEKREKEETIARLIIDELFKGPSQESLHSAIPEGTKLREVYIYDGVLYVDLSGEVSKNHPDGSSAEIATIFSIVNTLTFNLPQYPVKILIDGREQETLAGHISLQEAFIFNKDIVK